MGRLSLSLTAKMTREIMLLRLDWVTDRLLAPSTVGSSGNSRGSLPMMSKEVGPQVMLTVLPSVMTDTTSSGSLRTISPNRRAESTKEPSLATSASTRVVMPVSRL